MVRRTRSLFTGGVIVCLLSTQMSAMVFASEATDSTVNSPALVSPVKPLSTESDASAGQIYRGRPYGRRNRDGSIAAMIIGSAAVIAGTAVLVYANRPECSANQAAGGCGYGTKVVGTSVLVGGAVGLFVGAITW